MFSDQDICVSVMKQLFEQMVQDNESFVRHEEGIYFIIEIEGRNFGYEKDGNTFHEEWRKFEHKFVHVLIIRPHNVFIAVSDSSDTPEHEDFENTSNHDSCWRTDGFHKIGVATWDIYKDIYENTPDEHRPIPLAANMDFWLSHHWLGIGDVFKFVKVKMKYEGNSYKYHLESLEVVKKTITL